MRKQPFRPRDDRISQQFNDGVVTIYSVKDVAPPGRQPVQQRTEKAVLRYENRKLGIQRYYSALQNQRKIERVLRVPKSSVLLTSQDIAQTEDGSCYRIDLVQDAMSYPPSWDLTLKAYEQEDEE